MIDNGKNLAMRNHRGFSIQFKPQVVGELVSGQRPPEQLCCRYNITSSLLYHRKKQYGQGKFNHDPTQEWALRDRIEKLERLLGKLTLERTNPSKRGCSTVSVGPRETAGHHDMGMSRHWHLVGVSNNDEVGQEQLLLL